MELKMKEYLVDKATSVLKTLEVIDRNARGIVFVVDERRRLIGSISDGDIRRLLLQGKNIHDLNAEAIANTEVKYSVHYTNIPSGNIDIPIVNESKQVIDINYYDEPFRFNALIGSGTYVIAEIGNNHQGSVEYGMKLVDEAYACGVDAIKFQHRVMDQLYSNDAEDSLDLGTQYTKDLLGKFNLSKDSLFELMDYVKSKGVHVICTPFDSEALRDLIEYNRLDAIKVASADCTNLPFLEEILCTGLPVIISTGMTTEHELSKVSKIINKFHNNIALLHCNSTYPAPYHDLNLGYIKKLESLSPSGIVGWSGHERGWHICHVAVGLGAKVIEKHFTLDKNLEGNDHQVSLLPSEMQRMVFELKQIDQALLSSEGRNLSQGEMMNKENLSKSLCSKISLTKGTIIKEEYLEVRSPGNGISPLRSNEIIGARLLKDVSKGQIIQESDIFKSNENLSTECLNNHVFGIPVRFHDLHLAEKFGLKFVEFHLSYNDLNFDIDQLPDQQLNFVVHAPELFENDHILDLASDDISYRLKSIDNLNKAISLTERLITKYKPTNSVGIVTNVGGFSIHDFKDKSEIQGLYEVAYQSIQQLRNSTKIEIWPQTMPPYPWHFGGQRFHNLFTQPEDIVEWCSRYNMNICLDISHTGLYSLVDGRNPELDIMSLMPFSKHYHFADAKKPDGEGLQIGDGVLNFNEIIKGFKKLSPDSSFIPEIWQGHKNEGKEFCVALNRLNKFFENE